MQDAVDKILEGHFNNDVHALDFSSPVIELTLGEGEIYEGAFTIFGPENELTEGSVSSTRLRMHCLTDRFTGSKEEISYCFDASGMAEGDTIKGMFRIISNQGEYYVPYQVTISSGALESKLGSVKNLFHFTNLARTNWDEAVNLFYSRDFERIFNGADRQYYAAYRGLSGSSNREQGVEEFLLEIKKKQKVEFLLEEAELRLENPEDGAQSRLILNRNGWGYSELYAEADADFLVLEKEVIRDEDFLGNSYRLPFYIAQKKLHAGKNYGTIRLYNAYTELKAQVLVVCRSVVARVLGNRREKKHILLELMQFYEAFRTKKISAASWMKETERLVDRLITLDDHDAAAKLYQVQLLITEDRTNEAEWLLLQVADQVDAGEQPALYCYYLYLTTLLKREDAYIDEVAMRVERIFAQNDHNWRIAWLLLYLSEDYSRSPSKKWLVLEEQFRQGCKSPVLYIEAWNLVLQNPALLMRLGGFELQILSYAAKKELLTADVVEQVVYLAEKQKNWSGRLFSILKACYRIIPRDEVLHAICGLLIDGNMTEKFAFDWYEKGIEKELRITRLYEYYMMSLDLEENKVIPRIVLMYFAFDSNLDSIHNAYLYSYVYRNRGQYPELYENYREQIERFMVFQILKGRNNEYLSYLYKNLITPVMITEETARGLAVALFINRVVIKRRDIRRILLVYEKEKQEVVFPVMGREVYIPIYGSDYKLLLEDTKQNRYCREEEYTVERLLIPDKTALQIAPYVQDQVHFELWMCEKGRELAGVNHDNVDCMKRITESEQVQEEVKQELRMKLIHYFYDNDLMKDLDDYLAGLTPEQVEMNSFAEVVRFMVIRGMYEKAYEWVNLRGGEGIEAKIIVRLCSRLIALDGMAEDKTMTALIFMAFRAGKYDENLLTYLCRFFEGTCKEMRDIWKAADAFGIDCYELCERILKQMLYTGAFVGESTEIFKKYVAGGAKTEVELAFLAQCSYDYFVREKLTDPFIMEDMQRVIERGEEIPFVCKLAYTRYYAENKKLVDENISRYLLLFLRDITEKNIYFPYFMEYAENIVFMRPFLDKTMVEYRVREGNRAVIHYLIEREGNAAGEYMKEEMQDMFGGICVKQFILFFGERLQYYITEMVDGKESLTESGTLSRNDTGREQKESKYGLINDIATGRNLHDYETMEKLLYEYYEQEYKVNELFHML